MSTMLLPLPDCDFNDDGDCDVDDIDELTAETAAGTNNPDYDLNGDMLVNQEDIRLWLIEAGARPENAAFTDGNPFFRGDANLDGLVNGVDFVAWNAVKFTANTNWSQGNFNGDAMVDGPDFVIWNGNKFKDSKIDPGAPNIVDGLDPSFAGGRHGFASRAVSDVAPGKRVYRETDAAGY